MFWRPIATSHFIGAAVVLLAVHPVQALDLRNATVVVAPGIVVPQRKAVTMLVEEVGKRTRVQWSESPTWPASGGPVIAVGTAADLERFAGPHAEALRAVRTPIGPEGYRICIKREGATPAVVVIGEDARGVLFGVGRLLRELHLHPGSVTVDDSLDISSAPKYPLRGHQLGYRPKTHSYDAWDLPTWEQYFRDLIVFGCNAIELVPPRTDDDAESPHFPQPPLAMMGAMSALADSYGLDVWVWYPAMDADYSNPDTVESALEEWGKVFASLPRLDAVFVPGGDPGHTAPRVLMPFLEQQTRNLHRHHPKAQMWLSPQGFNKAWIDEFLDDLKRDQPAWLSGLVFGPQVRMDLPELRAAVPERYPLRHYPDITHSRQCQFPVPDWDVAYAVTEARECINPRPIDEAAIFRKTQPYTVGFITYSEGCNDDVNKAIWSALGWDPTTKVIDILRHYSRYFIGERYADDFARGLLALEQNWRGPLLVNDGVETTLRHFQTVEGNAAPADLRNWRFQQALFRAYYDAYIRQRLVSETKLEAQAMKEMAAAKSSGSANALDQAELILRRSSSAPNVNWRLRIHELAAALFQSISMQLSVPKYKAIAVDRGASLDTLDFPLNNHRWLLHSFGKIRALTGEDDRLKAIDEIAQWTNPGPGGYYDDLGNPGRQPHLVPGSSYADDPGRMRSARAGFEEDLVLDSPDQAAGVPRRISWIDHAETLYDTPLEMHYTGLDPKASYTLRVVYGGDNPERQMRLVAGGTIEIHPFIRKPFPFKPIEFAIPPAATAQGELRLTWTGDPGHGGNGRGCQVSEVWLIRQPPPGPSNQALPDK